MDSNKTRAIELIEKYLEAKAVYEESDMDDRNPAWKASQRANRDLYSFLTAYDLAAVYMGKCYSARSAETIEAFNILDTEVK